MSYEELNNHTITNLEINIFTNLIVNHKKTLYNITFAICVSLIKL